MTHVQSIRNYAKAVFAFATLAIVSACSDNAAAPRGVAITAPANFNQVGSSIIFSVNNAEGITQRIGNHLISIPAGAICDLATSGYGATYWDKACTPLDGSVVITATIFQDDDGMPYVDFQPAMRFAPDKEVMLFVRQGKNSSRKQLYMNYCNSWGYCYDESRTDPTLKPFRVGSTPILGRRLKHFSGYVIGSGETCEGTFYDYGDGTGWCEVDGGLTRRSGYMVASGKDVEDILIDKNQDEKKQDEQ